MNTVRPAVGLLLAATLLLSACGPAARTDPAPPAPTLKPAPKAAPAVRWVKLPHRAKSDAMDELSPDETDGPRRKLTRFLGARGKDQVGLDRLEVIVSDGFNGAREVLESDTHPFYRVWFSFRPHEAFQHTAFVVSRENEILAVASVHVDCPPEAFCDVSGPLALHIYVPKGKATPDRIEPLRNWAKQEEIWAPAPEQVIELP